MSASVAAGPSVLFDSPPYLSVPIFRVTSDVNSVFRASPSFRACHHSIPLSIDGLHDLREQNLALGG